MSSIPSIQCLFCKHLNPAGAIFCNECGTQLNVQPCDHCGAIDAREARNCHKCGAEFPLQATPESGRVSELLANGRDPALDSRADIVPPPDLVKDSHPMAAAAAWSRPSWRPAAAGLSLALIAAAALFYFDRVRPELLAQKSGVKQSDSVASARPTSEQTTQAAQTGGALIPTRSVTEAASRIVTPGNAAAPAPPVADSPIAVHSPPATNGDATTRQNSLASNECPQAIATLGLCNPDTAAKKRQ